MNARTLELNLIHQIFEIPNYIVKCHTLLSILQENKLVNIGE